MTNHTNIDPGGSDANYDQPGMIFVCLIIFIGFCSISGMLYQLCCGNHSVCGDLKYYYKKYCPHSYEDNEITEYEIDYDSEFQIEEVVKQEVEIKKVPTFSNVNHYPIYCSICQDDKTNTVKVDCGHNFCKECIMEYMKIGKECPNCREGIKNIYEIEVLVFK